MRRAQRTIWGAKIIDPPQKHHMTHDTKLCFAPASSLHSPPPPFLHGRVGPPPPAPLNAPLTTRRGPPLSLGPDRVPSCSRHWIGRDWMLSCANPSLDLKGRPIACRRCTPPRQTSPQGDLGSGEGKMSLSSAKIRWFPRSPRKLAPSMQWASRTSSFPSPCLHWPPKPPSSAAPSHARRQSRPPPLSANCHFLGSPAIVVVVITGRRIHVRCHCLISSCRPPPRPPTLFWRTC